mmetsp:Transcript_29760/g.33357  ORF Transcript_29760/g.33357 Transcript_29760/m.33357 type:complete len:84 (-) Transcript_29760:136-387(-)
MSVYVRCVITSNDDTSFVSTLFPTSTTSTTTHLPLDTDSNPIKIVIQVTCHYYVHHNNHYVVTGVIPTKENNEKRCVACRSSL